jgi:HEAT repeat protein
MPCVQGVRVLRTVSALALCGLWAARGQAGPAQEPPAPQAVSAAALQAAIDRLGDLEFTVRTAASRVIRRAPASQAIPALTQAVEGHRDGYVRYRALVLLTGFSDPRTKDSMRESLASPNDRLRSVAYGFFERRPDPSLMPDLLAALDKEQGEFVRPAAVRSLVALCRHLEQGPPAGSHDVARAERALLREVGRGEDYFRSAVIEALGDYRARYALDTLTAVARLDGPLQDDAALALGQIGDRKSLPTLASLQRTAPRKYQPTIAAAICLLGVNCDTHEKYLIETLTFAGRTAGFQELLRGAAAGLGHLAVAGRQDALDALFEIGLPATADSTRAPIALALATVALRNTSLMLDALGQHPKQAMAIDLVGEGFDMLEEDLDKETFFAAVRRTYWASPEGAPARGLMQTLIGKLEF